MSLSDEYRKLRQQREGKTGEETTSSGQKPLSQQYREKRAASSEQEAGEARMAMWRVMDQNARQDSTYEKYKRAIGWIGSEPLNKAVDNFRQMQNNARMRPVAARYMQAAAKTGDQAMYDDGYRKYKAAMETLDQENAYNRKRMDAKRKEDPVSYIGTSLTADELENEIRRLRGDVDRAESALNAAQTAGDSYDGYSVDEPEETDQARRLYLRSLTREERAEELQPAPTKEQAQANYDAANTKLRQYEQALAYRQMLDVYAMEEKAKASATFAADAEAGRKRWEANNAEAEKAAGGGDIDVDMGDDTSGSAGYYRAMQKRRELANQAGRNTDLDSGWMNEEQKQVYFALYNSNPEEAARYAKYKQQEMENRHYRELSDRSGKNLLSSLAAFVVGTGGQMIGGAANIIETIGGHPFGEVSQAFTKTGNATLGGGAEYWDRLSGTIDPDTPIVGDILGGKGLGALYQLASSIVQSGLTAKAAGAVALAGGTGSEIVEKLGLALMGSQAASTDYAEALQRGMDRNTAMAHAFAAGVAEAAFEEISLDKLVTQYAAPELRKMGWRDLLRDGLRDYFQTAGIEASEEVMTSLANRVSDEIISQAGGYDTQIEQRAKELVALGVSERDAIDKANREWMVDVINDGLGGFISGGFHTFANYAGAGISNQARSLAELGDYLPTATREASTEVKGTRGERRAFGRTIEESGGVEAVQKYAADNGIKAKAYNQDKQSKRQTGRLGRTAQDVTNHMIKQMDGKSLQEQAQVYTGLVEQYGEGIRETANEALRRSSMKTMNETQSQRWQNKEKFDYIEDPAARSVLEKTQDYLAFNEAMDRATSEGDEKAADYAIGTLRTKGITMEHTVTGEDGKTARVKIEGLTEDGKRVKLADGTTVKAEELKTDADTRDIFRRFTHADMGSRANEIFNIMQAEQSAGRTTDLYGWAMDAANVYDQGRQGVIKAEEAAKQARHLSQDAVGLIYNMAREDVQKMDAKARAELQERLKVRQEGATGRKGSVTYSREIADRIAKDEALGHEAERIKRFAEAFGVDVELFSSELEDGKYKGKSGQYKDGKIWIDVNAGKNKAGDTANGMIYTMAHEMTHFMQEYNPEAYRQIKEFALRQIQAQKGRDVLEGLIREKQRRHTGQKALSRERAEDEVAAEFCETMLTDNTVLETLADENPGLFQTVLDWVKDFLAKIKEKLTGLPAGSYESQVYRAMDQQLRETFGKLWAQGIAGAVQTHDQVGSLAEGNKNTAQESGNDTKNSDRAAEQYADDVDEWNENGRRGDQTFILGSTSDVMQALGAMENDIYLLGEKINDIQNDHPEMTLKTIKSIPQILNDPILILKSKNAGRGGAQNTRLVIFGSVNAANGLPVLSVLDLHPVEGHIVIDDMQKMTSAYTKTTNPVDFVRNSVVMYADKKRATQTLRTIGFQMPIELVQGGYIGSISYMNDSVNLEGKQYSDVFRERPAQNSDRPSVDNTGRELSEGQQEYFKDSAVRDESGRLLTMYHGTTAFGEITKFKRGKSGWLGPGVYLTSRKADAQRYADAMGPGNGSLYEMYANVTNPLVVTSGNPVPDILMAAYGRESVYKARSAKQTNDPNILTQADIRKLQAKGYDGILWRFGKAVEVSVFDQNQVKRIDNRNPTENPDIRYQDRSYDLPSDAELIAGIDENQVTDKAGKDALREAKAAAKRIQDLEAKLAEARRQLTTTQRGYNTKGITGTISSIMNYFGMGDADGKGILKNAAATLRETYDAAIEQIDKGDNAAALEALYNGARQVAEYLMDNGTYREKVGYKWMGSLWTRAFASTDEARQNAVDEVVSRVYADFVENRYRDAVQPTAADRIVERTENKYKPKLEAAEQANRELSRANEKLTRERDFYSRLEQENAKRATYLHEQLTETRQALKEESKANTQERKKLNAKAERLSEQLREAREQAKQWKAKAEHGGVLARQMAASKNRDIQAAKRQAEQARQAAVREKEAVVRKLEKQLQREQDILSGKLKPVAIQRMLKDARENAAEEMAKHKEEVFANKQERRKQTELRGRIDSLKKELRRRLSQPTDRTYVPAGLVSSLVDVLETIDNSPVEGTKAAAKYQSVSESLRAMADAYESLKGDESVGWEYQSEYDEEIRDQIRALEKTLQGRNIRELTSAELQQVYDQVKQVRDILRDATKTMSGIQYKSLYEAMDAVASQQRSMKSMNKIGWWNRKKRLRMLDSMSVMRATEMMAGWDRNAALYQLMHAVENGVDESWRWVMEYNKSLQDLKTGKNEKEYRNALTKKLDLGITDAEGLPVLMTKMQALQILMTAEREANNENLVHLQKGGAVIRDADAILSGKAAKAKSQQIEVTPELLQKIRDGLTEWDKAYMKTIREYFAKEGKATNRVLYQLKHKVLQTEEYYVPYIVDKNYLDAKLDEQGAMTMWVKVPGSTNALQKQSPKPVIIDGMETVMAKHVKEIGDYVGLALPIRDFSKVYNGRLQTGESNPLPVKGTIGRNFGEKGQHLLTQAIIDVQGGGSANSWRNYIAEHLNWLQGAFVRSALLVNPSVTIKQAASYTAAESILSYRALVAGNRPTGFEVDSSHSPSLILQLFAAPESRTAKRIYNEIDKYTSAHYQRRLGMSQEELANEVLRSNKLRRWMNGVGASLEQNAVGHAARKAGAIANPVTWIQRMDVATTAALWVACKEQAKIDGKTVGSEEYWKHTTELYERCLRETQPMYDSMHRTAFQKGDRGIMQYLFPFRTVPIQNHGQIAASYENLLAAKESGDKARMKEAGKFFRKTVVAQTKSAIVFSVMTFLAAAMKRKTKKYRDEDEEIDVGTVLAGIGMDTASTWFSNIFPVFGSELWSIGDRAYNKVSGKSAYSFDAFSVGAVDMLNSLAESGDKLLKDTGKFLRGEDVRAEDFGKHGLDFILKAAKIGGIPADTVRTYWEGLMGNLEDIRNGRIPALNDAAADRAAGMNAKRYWEAYEAGDAEKMGSVLAEMRDNYKADGKSEKKTEELVRNAIGKLVTEAWDSEKIDLAEAEKRLEQTGLFDEEKLANRVLGFVQEEVKAGTLSDEAALAYLAKYKPNKKDSENWATLQEWKAKGEYADEYKAEHGDEDEVDYEDFDFEQYGDVFAAVEAGKNLGAVSKDLLAHGYTEKQIRDAAVDHVRELLKDGKVSESKAVSLVQKYKQIKEDGTYRPATADEAWFTVREWSANNAHAEDEDYSYKKYEDVYKAIDGGLSISTAVKALTDHGVKEEDVKKEIKGYLKEQYLAGAYSESQIKQHWKRYLNTSATEAKQVARWLELQRKNPTLKIEQSRADSYYDGTTKTRENGHASAQAAGMTIQQYLEAKEILGKVKGVDKDGNGRTDDGSTEIAYIHAIAKMNLTSGQKWALYYEKYKGANRKKGIWPTW